MKDLIIILFIVHLSSCTKDYEQVNTIYPTSSTVTLDKKEDWSNPVFIKGSSFGDIINALYRIGDFQLLLKLTDSTSRATMTDAQIITSYKNMGLGFNMTLVSMANVNNNHTLNYRVEVNATNQIIQMPIVIEKDTVRLQLIPFKNELQKLNR